MYYMTFYCITALSGCLSRKPEKEILHSLYSSPDFWPHRTIALDIIVASGGADPGKQSDDKTAWGHSQAVRLQTFCHQLVSKHPGAGRYRRRGKREVLHVYETRAERTSLIFLRKLSNNNMKCSCFLSKRRGRDRWRVRKSSLKAQTPSSELPVELHWAQNH